MITDGKQNKVHLIQKSRLKDAKKLVKFVNLNKDEILMRVNRHK